MPFAVTSYSNKYFWSSERANALVVRGSGMEKNVGTIFISSRKHYMIKATTKVDPKMLQQKVEPKSSNS